MKNTVNTKLAILALTIFAIVLFIATKTLNPTIPEESTAIIPGKTSLSTALKNTEPYHSQNQNGEQIYYVGTGADPFFRTYHSQSGNVDYYVERDPSKYEFERFSDYLGKYGNANMELWGPWASEAGFKSYIFLTPGIIIIAHPTSQEIAQIWSIPPNLEVAEFSAIFGNQFKEARPSPHKHF